jgi:hypothetical protein
MYVQFALIAHLSMNKPLYKQTRLICIVLAVSVSLLAGCQPRPTGISGVIKIDNVKIQDLELHVVELDERGDVGGTPIFVEGDTIAKSAVGEEGRFEVRTRPGNYVVKLFSGDGELITSRRIAVRRNRMTRIELE